MIRKLPLINNNIFIYNGETTAGFKFFNSGDMQFSPPTGTANRAHYTPGIT